MRYCLLSLNFLAVALGQSVFNNCPGDVGLMDKAALEELNYLRTQDNQDKVTISKELVRTCKYHAFDLNERNAGCDTTTVLDNFAWSNRELETPRWSFCCPQSNTDLKCSYMKPQLINNKDQMADCYETVLKADSELTTASQVKSFISSEYRRDKTLFDALLENNGYNNYNMVRIGAGVYGHYISFYLSDSTTDHSSCSMPSSAMQSYLLAPVIALLASSLYFF